MRTVLERLLNLLAFLLTARRPVTADEIRTTIPGYSTGSDDAFRRMFERDKELLRRMGIPLKAEPTAGMELGYGYVIPPDEYRLPDPDLTDEERTALWLAAQVVRIGGQPSAAEAILKLGGARTSGGVEPFAVDLGADVDLLGNLYAAITDRRMVRFSYRDRARHVAPHGLGHRRGHWYLVGKEGGETRVYRIDRISSLTTAPERGAFKRDPSVSVRRELDAQPWETGSDASQKVKVVFDPDVAWWAVRRLKDEPTLPRPDGGVEVVLEVNHLEAFIGWILSFGPQAEVLEPAAIRSEVIRRVEAVQV